MNFVRWKMSVLADICACVGGVDTNGWKSPDAMLEISPTSISLIGENKDLTPLETQFRKKKNFYRKPFPKTLLLWFHLARIRVTSGMLLITRLLVRSSKIV